MDIITVTAEAVGHPGLEGQFWVLSFMMSIIDLWLFSNLLWLFSNSQ
jgi:hypothetical protein